MNQFHCSSNDTRKHVQSLSWQHEPVHKNVKVCGKVLWKCITKLLLFILDKTVGTDKCDLNNAVFKIVHYLCSNMLFGVVCVQLAHLSIGNWNDLSIVVCLRCLVHHILFLIAYTFQENREFVFIIIVQFMMSANNRIRFVLKIKFVCLYITPSHYYHRANLSEDIELIKCLSDCILSSVWVR